MYICICVYIYIYIYIYTHIHTYVYTHVYKYMSKLFFNIVMYVYDRWWLNVILIILLNKGKLTSHLKNET